MRFSRRNSCQSRTSVVKHENLLYQSRKSTWLFDTKIDPLGRTADQRTRLPVRSLDTLRISATSVSLDLLRMANKTSVTVSRPFFLHSQSDILHCLSSDTNDLLTTGRSSG